MKRPIVCTSFLILVCVFAQTSSASIGGVYSGTFETGGGGGALWSYVHAATSSPMTPPGGYEQNAGGSIFFRISDTDTFTYTFTDNNTAGLSDGDTIDMDIAVDLYEYNTNTIVGELTLTGRFEVGGASSAAFTHGIRNITGAGDSFAGGLEYEVTLSADSNGFTTNEMLNGDSFFQAAPLAGPFNGISYVNGELIFAAWGNSSNSETSDTGRKTNMDSFTQTDLSLGFDLYSRASMIPEPGAIVCWTLLGLCGAGLAGRRRK